MVKMLGKRKRYKQDNEEMRNKLLTNEIDYSNLVEQLRKKVKNLT